MRRVRGVGSVVLGVLCIAGGALGVLGTPAWAGTTYSHKYLSQLTEAPAGPGVTQSGPFAGPMGLASVAGDVYVADPGHTAVDEFDASGGLVSQISDQEAIEDEEEMEPGVAVDQATGEVLVTIRDSLYAFSATGELLAKLEDGELSPPGLEPPLRYRDPHYLAVDNSTSSSDPAAGYLYLASSRSTLAISDAVNVLKHEPGGSFSYATRLDGAGTPAGSFSIVEDGLAGVAVDEASGEMDGDVLVADSEHHVVDVFKPKAGGEDEYLFQVTGAGAPGGSFGELGGVAVDSSTGDIYVVDKTAKAVDQFTAAGGFLGQLTGTSSGSFEEPYDVVASSNGDLYVSDAAAKVVDVFGPTVTITTPDVTTGLASGLHGVGVTLNGTVNPEEVPVGTCQFEYGLSEAYGSSAPCVPTPAPGKTPQAVAAGLAGLVPGVTYHYRLSVTDGEGVTVHGADATFKTELPVVQVAVPSGLASTSATLNATVNPNEVPLEACQFEYGPSEAYGSLAPCASLPAPGASAVTVSAAITGLPVDSVYRYRLALKPVDSGTLYSAGEAVITAPTVESSGLASGITSFAATLTGVLLSGEVTPEYSFEYGPTSAYGSLWPQPDVAAGADGQQTVSQTVSGLQPGTTYHYALIARNFAGGLSVGPDETFTTRPLVPPTVSTSGAQEITSTSAALTGTLNAEGLATTYRFEYGTSTAYGSSWPAVQAFAGSGNSVQGIAVTVPDLQPGVTYHYRLAASNEDGTSYGTDQTFATPGYPVSIVQEPAVLTKLGFFNPEAGHPPGKSSKPKGKHKGKAKKRGKRGARAKGRGGKKG